MSKLFWVVLRGVWPGWRRSLILVTPQTVVRWHRVFVISHDRRRILHYNVTRHPNAFWTTLQLHEALQYGESAMRFLISDNDVKFSKDVVAEIVDLGCSPMRAGFRSPWQNGVAERWVGSIRRDLLDHVIVLNERHMRRLLRDYVRYYHEDRTHLGLAKETPSERVMSSGSTDRRLVTSQPRLGGLHHRYQIAA